ncbi:MAG: HlyD family type I secretion periplasmic adaptor subunit [Paracoccaceae bacterium]
MSQNNWSARAPVIIGMIGLVVFFGGFVAWGVITQISGAIIASGRIEVDQNRQIVQHPTGGVVSDIRVQEGDVVIAGDVLIELDKTQLVSQLSIVEGQLYELMARRGRLEAERDGDDLVEFEGELLSGAQQNSDIDELVNGQNNLFFARRESTAREKEQMGQRRIQITNQIQGIDAQETSLEEQLSLIQQELTSQQSLFDRGLAPAGTVLALQRQSASLGGQLGELAASKAQAQERITELEIQELSLTTQRREEAITTLRDLRYRELEFVEQRSSLIADIERQLIRAPVSGIVYGLRVQTMRSVIRGADPVLYLVPQDRPLVIAARVDPIHIDQIVTGQAVNLRFSALDQRTTPELEGKVTLVSADAFEDEQVGVSYYRAEIILNPGEVEKLTNGQILIPGMPVEAFIRTADRSPLGYLIKPLADYFNRAFRES